MPSPARSARPASKRPTTAKPAAQAERAKVAARERAKKAATNLAIASELAPAVAIALLDKTQQAPGAAAPALDCLAAAAAPSDTDGKVRVQLLFESGAVLPVEMSEAAGAALSKALAAELPDK